jgi:hypothetical protein
MNPLAYWPPATTTIRPQHIPTRPGSSAATARHARHTDTSPQSSTPCVCLAGGPPRHAQRADPDHSNRDPRRDPRIQAPRRWKPTLEPRRRPTRGISPPVWTTSSDRTNGQRAAFAAREFHARLQRVPEYDVAGRSTPRGVSFVGIISVMLYREGRMKHMSDVPALKETIYERNDRAASR